MGLIVPECLRNVACSCSKELSFLFLKALMHGRMSIASVDVIDKKEVQIAALAVVYILALHIVLKFANSFLLGIRGGLRPKLILEAA